MNRQNFLDWTVYQIYPRSFYDSNGDGIGDLRGIIKKLDHLTELGVNAVWLCPCYKSPNADNGYDVADYRDIDPAFGSFADWKALQKALQERGIKLIMDFVANHTSSKHPWFEQARSSRDNPYHDYYIWADKPLNAWKSVFGGSAWEYNAQTDEYYLHSFAVEQPDLNWTNPKVRKEMRDIIDFWVEQGVDGFRCDVLDFIAKDFKKNKMYDGAHLHEYIRELFDRESTKDLFIIGECKSDEKSICDICGKNRGELTTVFQFEHTQFGGVDKYLPHSFTLDDFKAVLVKWQYFTAKNELLYTLFTDNHDQPFLLSRFGLDGERRYEAATMLAAAVYLLKGIPFLYQGQEYGAVNSSFTDIDHFNDVETRHYYQANRKDKRVFEKINRGSRDNPRRPMAWNGEKHYGFTTDTPWLKAPTRGDEINLEKDKRAQKSVFAFYKALLSLRKQTPALRYGVFADKTQGKGYFAYTRKYLDQTLLIICNFEKERTLPLPQSLDLLLSNYPDRETTPKSPLFRPFETAIYKMHDC